MRPADIANGLTRYRSRLRDNPKQFAKDFRNNSMFVLVENQPEEMVPLGWAIAAIEDGWEEKTSTGDSGNMRVRAEYAGLHLVPDGAEKNELWRISHEIVSKLTKEHLPRKQQGFSNRDEGKRKRNAQDNSYFLIQITNSPKEQDLRQAIVDLQDTEQIDGFKPPKSWFVHDPLTGNYAPLKWVWGTATKQLGRDFKNTAALREKISKLGFVPKKSGSWPNTAMTPGKLKEGKDRQYTRNVKERSKKARQACIEYFESQNGGRIICECCEIDFGKTYGEIGEGFIHVHHVEQLSSKPSEYEINPIEGLVPVCPNCHAMVHRGNKNRDLSVIKALLKERKQKREI